MGSYPMLNGVHDFEADKYNDAPNGKAGVPSGKKAGVEDGLNYVQGLSGNIEAEQKTNGNVFRQERPEVAAGSKNGKNFKFK
jgi:hypothetical protein